MDPEEEKAIQELMAMSDEELLLVDFTLVKWQCFGKKCCNGTKIRDYGIAPIYWKRHRTLNKNNGFFNINDFFWMCGKHAKMQKRLLLNFDRYTVDQKLFDDTKPKIVAL